MAEPLLCQGGVGVGELGEGGQCDVMHPGSFAILRLG